MVVLKVVQTDDSDVIGALVRSTNRQSQVDPTQFLSMSEASKAIERYFVSREEVERHPLYYERRTGQYNLQNELPSSRIFDMRQIARCTAAMFFDYPHIARRYPGQLIDIKVSPDGDSALVGKDKKSAEDAKPLYAVIFDKENIEEIYYTSAYAFYRLHNAISNSKADGLSKYKTAIYHIMMGIRAYLIKSPVPPSSPKMKAECEELYRFVQNLNGTNMSILKAICSHLGPASELSRDKLKGQRFSGEYKASIIANRDGIGKGTLARGVKFQA